MCANAEGTIWPKIAPCYKKNQIVSISLCSKSPTVFPQVYWVNLRQLTVALFLSGYASALSTLVSPFGVVLQQSPGCLHLLGTGPAAEQFHCTLLPEESQWGALSKSKRGLGGTHCSDPRGSHTTTKSFRVSVTLLARGKNVKLPRAPIPAWSGDCALERVNCFLCSLFAGDWQLLNHHFSFFHQGFSWLIILSV